MFDFVKNLFGGGYEKLVEKQVELDGYEAEVKMMSKNISEPVMSIIKTFSEKGRWKISYNDTPLVRSRRSPIQFTFTDTKTGEEHIVRSDYSYNIYLEHLVLIPRSVSRFYMPSWMTEEESKFVSDCIAERMSIINERFQRIEDKYRKKSQAVCKVNQQKERQRLMSIYCKE